MSDTEQRHSTRVAIISACVSLALSVVFAAYIVGQRTGKVLEIDSWKRGNRTAHREEWIWRVQWQPRILLRTYNQEQAKQYKRLDKLEEEVSHLDKWNCG